MTEIIIAGQPVQKVTAAAKRFNGAIWGDAGCGKTTLAGTAPGRKLWYQFDPDGVDSISDEVCEKEGIIRVDLSQASTDKLADECKNEGNPFGIKSTIEAVDTYIFDSITNLTDKTLTRGISTNTGATVERPSPGAYGTRNALAIRAIKNVAKITGVHKKNVIWIAHEGAPDKDEKTGAILHISLALGGQLPSNIGIDFSELWAMYQVDNRADRRIMIRPARLRKPMKTRMFRQGDEPEFDWKFDPDDWFNKKNLPYRIDTWLKLWELTGDKLPLPGSQVYMNLVKRFEKELPAYPLYS